MVRDELLRFNPELGDKRQMIVVNKLDVTEVRECREELAVVLKSALREMGESSGDVLFISAATGEGVDELVARISSILAELPKDEVSDQGTSSSEGSSQAASLA